MYRQHVLTLSKMCVLPIVQHQYQMNRLHVNTVNTNPEWIWSKDTRFIRYSKCTIKDREHVNTVDTKCSTQNREKYLKKVIQNEGLLESIHPNMSTQSIQVDLVFEMFYSKQREILKKGHLEWRFVRIHPSKYVDTVDTGWSGIWNVLLKTQKVNMCNPYT